MVAGNFMWGFSRSQTYQSFLFWWEAPWLAFLSLLLFYFFSLLFNSISQRKRDELPDPILIYFYASGSYSPRNTISSTSLFILWSVDYEKRVEDLRKELERGNTKLEPTIFKIKRSACLACNRCSVFKGNFKESLFSTLNNTSKTTDFLCCFNCQCPMSAHVPSKSTSLHRPYIWKYLKAKEIKD